MPIDNGGEWSGFSGRGGVLDYSSGQEGGVRHVHALGGRKDHRLVGLGFEHRVVLSAYRHSR